jgi:hypothetical protein
MATLFIIQFNMISILFRNFTRTVSGPEPGAFYHQFFLRDKPHLAAQMFCKNARSMLAMASEVAEKKNSRATALLKTEFVEHITPRAPVVNPPVLLPLRSISSAKGGGEPSSASPPGPMNAPPEVAHLEKMPRYSFLAERAWHRLPYPLPTRMGGGSATPMNMPHEMLLHLERARWKRLLAERITQELHCQQHRLLLARRMMVASWQPEPHHGPHDTALPMPEEISGDP